MMIIGEENYGEDEYDNRWVILFKERGDGESDFCDNNDNCNDDSVDIANPLVKKTTVRMNMTTDES